MSNIRIHSGKIHNMLFLVHPLSCLFIILKGCIFFCYVRLLNFLFHVLHVVHEKATSIDLDTK